mmetsp:Transcript_4316/g.4878  ORF Transcript_4316/g.4878 Transcript_4316/m.4878 type:complete len:105 (+) Transcript_4316:1-315(+)
MKIGDWGAGTALPPPPPSAGPVTASMHGACDLQSSALAHPVYAPQGLGSGPSTQRAPPSAGPLSNPFGSAPLTSPFSAAPASSAPLASPFATNAGYGTGVANFA